MPALTYNDLRTMLCQMIRALCSVNRSQKNVLTFLPSRCAQTNSIGLFSCLHLLERGRLENLNAFGLGPAPWAGEAGSWRADAGRRGSGISVNTLDGGK